MKRIGWYAIDHSYHYHCNSTQGYTLLYIYQSKCKEMIRLDIRWYTWGGATNWVIRNGSLLSLSSAQTTTVTSTATWWMSSKNNFIICLDLVFCLLVFCIKNCVVLGVEQKSNTCKLRIGRKAQTWLFTWIVLV